MTNSLVVSSVFKILSYWICLCSKACSMVLGVLEQPNNKLKIIRQRIFFDHHDLPSVYFKRNPAAVFYFWISASVWR